MDANGHFFKVLYTSTATPSAILTWSPLVSCSLCVSGDTGEEWVSAGEDGGGGSGGRGCGTRPRLRVSTRAEANMRISISFLLSVVKSREQKSVLSLFKPEAPQINKHLMNWKHHKSQFNILVLPSNKAIQFKCMSSTFKETS